MDILLVFTATATALMAGLFYAWTVSFMPGFGGLPNREFIAAMQSANRAIQNPAFFAAFLGAPVLLPVSTILHYGATARFWLLLAATAVYLTGTFGVTVFGNVPMNNRLDRFDLSSATEDETARRRAEFERRWNSLNTVRTVSSTLAVVLVVLACLN